MSDLIKPSEENIFAEAKAFDHQIVERVKNGHIPDLRLTKVCEWFYNNPWRHPSFVKLDFGEQFCLIRNAIDRFCGKPDRALKVLEVGCGPGYLSLELARNGYKVTGMDISPECISIAQKFAFLDPWKKERGELTYVAGDFLASPELPCGYFDAIVFLATLHHFKNQQKVMSRVAELLNSRGIVIAHEPTRDRVTEGNAAFIHLLRLLLSVGGGFYHKMQIPADIEEQKREIARVLSEMKYLNEEGGKVQSQNDNDAGYAEMYRTLGETFEELLYQDRYAFFHEIIGGLRFDEATNVSLARYLRDADAHLCRLGVLQPTEFFFVGLKRNVK